MNTQDNSTDISQNQVSPAAVSGCSMNSSNIERHADEKSDALLDSYEQPSVLGGTPTSKANQQSEAQQIKLLEEGDANACAELARHSGLSRTVQARLLQNKEEAVLVAFASNPSLFDEGQEKLASTGAPAVREALAANPGLNEKQQNYLAMTGSDEVKCKLAINPSLIVAIQSLLADEKVSCVREALAENPSLDKACQSRLMEDNDEYGHQIIYTLMPLASNPALSNDLQNRMAESNDHRIVASLAKNPSISDELMKKLAVSDNDEVRAGLACNTSLPESLQARLIERNGGGARKNLAGNPSLKIAQQAQLAHVGDVDVRLALLENPSLDELIRMRVIASFRNYDLSSAESSLDYAAKKAIRLNTEHREALQKGIDSYGGFLTSSEEKMNRLNRAVDRIQSQIDEVDREIAALENKCYNIKILLKQHPILNISGVQNPHNFGGGILSGLINTLEAA